MIILIPLAFSLFSILFYSIFSKDFTSPFRRSFLTAGLAIFLFVAISTELLSLFNAINKTAIAFSWSLLNVGLVIIVRKIFRNGIINFGDLTVHFKLSRKALYGRLGLFTVLLLGILLAITFTVALVAFPNNLDALSYHLSRLGYWTQNGHIGHYPSHIERAISFSPLSEYVHLHFFLLSGSERFFQLVQWLSFAGVLALVSLLTERFTTSPRALRVTILFAATLPIVVLESMTTQNDIVAAFFVLAATFFVFDFLQKPYTPTLFILAATVALGMMAKGTFAFFALPFGLYFLVKTISKPHLRRSLTITILATIFLTLALNTPFWYRTYHIFGTPVGTISQGNQTHFNSPADYVSSVSRHVFLHLGSVSPGDRYNQALLNGLTSLHQTMGIPLNNPRNGMDFKMNKLNFNEDFAHNFLGIWLILFSLPLLFFARLSRETKWYAALCVASILTFCFFISYQIYGSRLHIAFFLLFSPVIGIVYGKILPGFLSGALILILWIFALPFTLLSSTRPLLSTKWFFEEIFPPVNAALHLNINISAVASSLKQESILSTSKEEQLWGNQLPEIEQLKQYVQQQNPSKIGFIFMESSYDYALQFSLRKPGRTFYHVAVQNPSRALEDPDLHPDLIIAEYDQGDDFTYHGKNYKLGWHVLKRWVYIPEP